MKTILFDLDGTLTNPFEGITNCIRHALQEMGQPLVPPEELEWCIGPPLMECFAKLLETDDESIARTAVDRYRDRFVEKGMFENEVYEGIEDLLGELRGRGHRLFVATAKPQPFAEQVLAYFGLGNFFERIYGAELDGTRSRKPDLVRYLMSKEELIPEETVMVGDRDQDMRGAGENGLRAVGVLWGYGSEEELRGAGADHLVREVGELPGLIQEIC